MSQRRTPSKAKHATGSRNATAAAGSPRRGRPPKFGRPAQLVALTLPEDVLESLRAVHADPGWAIVQLVERLWSKDGAQRKRASTRSPIELAYLPGRRALIVTEPHLVTGLRGVSAIPLSDGRAFLAFDGHAGLADFELAIIDRIDELPSGSAPRKSLMQVREVVRAWRQQPNLAFLTKSIIVVEGATAPGRRPLAALSDVERGHDVGPDASHE